MPFSIGKAFEKCIDALSSATSTLYRPHRLKVMTKSTVESLSQLGLNINEIDMDVKIDDGILSIEVHRQVEKLPSDIQFLIGQEMKKQENIQKIVENALIQLATTQDSEVNDEPVNESWMLHFLDSSGFATEEEVQRMWSKILSDEVKKPGSYSLRTLKALETMTKEDADTFTIICNNSFGILFEDSHFVCSKMFQKSIKGAKFLDIVKMEELGLLVGGLSLTVEPKATVVTCGSTVFVHTAVKEKIINMYRFSKIADELFRLVTVSNHIPSDQDLIEMFRLKSGEKLGLHLLLPNQKYMISPYRTITAP